MARQNIVTPRIYLNIPEYLAAIGSITIDPVFRTLPSGLNTPSTVTSIPDISAGGNINLYDSSSVSLVYLAILGHTESNGTSLTIEGDGDGETGYTSLINGDFSSGVSRGFSIVKCDSYATGLTVSNSIGSVVTGIFYDFPVNPDMNLSLEYEYKGRKEIESKGGHTLSNTYYSGPPRWSGSGLGAWELGGDTNLSSKHAKSGRRIWKIKFSFMSDDKIWPTNAGLQNEFETAADSGVWNENTLLQENTLQRAIHITQGGQIPMLFQYDNTRFHPDTFAIAKFDMKSLKLKQTSFNTYSTSLSIKECW